MEVKKQYSLNDFRNIMFNGFHFELPEEVLKMVNELSTEVGSPTYVKTPIFQKREHLIKTSKDDLSVHGSSSNLNNVMNSKTNPNHGQYPKRRRGKNVETVTDDDWETIRTFNATKMEEKTGVDAKFDLVRSYLNKLTDKNVDEMSDKIITTVEEMKKDREDTEVLQMLCQQIFENAFTNRFYSKIYTIVYKRIIDHYGEKISSLNYVNELLEKINESIRDIHFVDSSVNYDLFCKINKENERRKAMCEFLVHLMLQKITPMMTGIDLLHKLFDSLFEFISVENKKNEVDELSELIAILWKKELYLLDHIEGFDKTIMVDFSKKIEKLASSKTKDYLSLTNKTIFKFMDMMEL